MSRSLLRSQLAHMPPLPQHVGAAASVNALLASARGALSNEQQLTHMVELLKHDSLLVRCAALQDLHAWLAAHRQWTAALVSDCVARGQQQGAATTDGQRLLSGLMAALLRCCDQGGSRALAAGEAQQWCAQCLGLLGAIDPGRCCHGAHVGGGLDFGGRYGQPRLHSWQPLHAALLDTSATCHHVPPHATFCTARLRVEFPPPAPMAATDLELLRALLQDHLLRMLWAATDLPMLDSTVYALQETLRIGAQLDPEGHLSTDASDDGQGTGGSQQQDTSERSAAASTALNRLYASLEEDVQASVRPYLDSRFTLVNTPVTPGGVLWGSAAAGAFRSWLQLWMRQLILTHCKGRLSTRVGWWCVCTHRF